MVEPLIAVGRPMGWIYPEQSVAKIGCDQRPPTSTLHEGSAVQGLGGGAPSWSIAVYWVCWPWDIPGGGG